ncbi:MAG TPA: anthranilate phosphoribosyltransferase [Gemmataceae bacterium]|nr:anthranilate phosphoribosyltransferase [Gemmataceae bacterium]
MMTIDDILQKLNERRDLHESALIWIVGEMMAGRCADADAAAFLLALRAKGETASEIACAAQVMRRHMLPWDAGVEELLDTCGTGGDGAGTFNISTATALVLAAAGVPVVKHGNRSVSSRTGSADVLAALGIKIDGDADFARRCLSATGFAFCFAPHFHPAMKHVAAVRKSLGVPTIFNCLGPLANPAGATRQLLGVGRPDLLDRMAGALAQLGTRRSFILCSTDGLDEVSLAAPTSVREVRGNEVISHQWTPSDFGLEPCALADLAVADAKESAAIILSVLAGTGGPAERIVLANAAAGLLVADRVTSLAEGVAQARDVIRSGRALRVVETLRRL